MSVDHVRQKLWEAMNSLVSDGSIQDRLAYAAGSLVQLSPKELDLLPDDLRKRFDTVTDSLTKHPAERTGEGSTQASARKIGSEEGTRLAREIVSIYIAMRGTN